MDESGNNHAAGNTAKQSSGGWFASLGTGTKVLIVIIGLLLVFNLLMDGEPRDSHGVSKSTIIANAQVEVKHRLKNPSAAKFSGVTATNSGSTWTVRGKVTSTNSFGATVTESFVVKMEVTSGKTYRLISCTIG